jgi:hypothetical protein
MKTFQFIVQRNCDQNSALLASEWRMFALFCPPKKHSKNSGDLFKS